MKKTTKRKRGLTRTEFIATAQQCLNAMIIKTPLGTAKHNDDPDYRMRAESAVNYTKALDRVMRAGVRP